MMQRHLLLLLSIGALMACGVPDRGASLGHTVPAPPAPMPDPTDPVDPIDPDPEIATDLVPVDLDGAVLRCVSEPVDYAGAHYRFDLRAGEELTEVSIDFVQLPQGLEVDAAEAQAPVRLVEERVPLATEGFSGFETGTAWLVLDADPEDGFAAGRMGRLDVEREVIVSGDRRELTVSCFQDEVVLPARYDAAVGGCVDREGAPAMNDAPLGFVLATGVGRCARLEGTLNGGAFGYPIYRDVDLRGADLSGAQLSFASLHRAKLEGANLSTFEFGYSVVDGSVDVHTRLPENEGCEDGARADHFRCLR